MYGLWREATARGVRRVGMAVAVAVWLSPAPAAAQRGGGDGQPPASPRAAAPIDVTGTWVSLVTDDWRWRMMTPPKGDVLYLPVNEAGRRAAEAWDPAADEAAGDRCKGYGAPGVMGLPGRIRIAWQDDTTLRLETDTGQQTRLFSFAAGAAAAAPSRQGHSVAAWALPAGRRGRAGGGVGQLKVVTTNLLPGYYRKNGVPYGGGAVFTEYYVVVRESNGDEYLNLTWFLEDPQYLNGPFVRTVHFRKEPNDAKWAPTPCSAR